MKILLVIGTDDSYAALAANIRTLGFEMIRYRHALKAMDNIDEVDPDAVLISAEDFPRHWKTLVQFIRSERSKEKTPIVLLKGPNFPFEEAAKASFIGVSGIVSEYLEDKEELDRLRGIISRYIPLEEGRTAKRIRPAEWDNFSFVFAHPERKIMVTGTIETISSSGLSFLPEHPIYTEDIPLNTALPECSLRVGDCILAPSCILVRTGHIISLNFESFPPTEKAILDAYIGERPLRERRFMDTKA